MQIETRLSDQLARYLDLATTESKLTASNMANLDTPGYKALGIDFSASMRQALGDQESGSGPGSPAIGLAEGLISRPDGNNVSMDRESLNLAEAQLRFRTGVALIRMENQRVMNAIHADKG